MSEFGNEAFFGMIADKSQRSKRMLWEFTVDGEDRLMVVKRNPSYRLEGNELRFCRPFDFLFPEKFMYKVHFYSNKEKTFAQSGIFKERLDLFRNVSRDEAEHLVMMCMLSVRERRWPVGNN